MVYIPAANLAYIAPYENFFWVSDWSLEPRQYKKIVLKTLFALCETHCFHCKPLYDSNEFREGWVMGNTYNLKHISAADTLKKRTRQLDKIINNA